MNWGVSHWRVVQGSSRLPPEIGYVSEFKHCKIRTRPGCRVAVYMSVVDTYMIEFTVRDEILISVGVGIANTVNVDFPYRFGILDRRVRAGFSRITPIDVNLMGIRSCEVYRHWKTQYRRIRSEAVELQLRATCLALLQSTK